MRRGLGGQLLLTKKRSMWGINLGMDNCEEHQGDIQPLVKRFGLQLDQIGIKGHTITRCPRLVLIEQKKYTVLLAFDDGEDRYDRNGIDLASMWEKGIYPFDKEALWPHTQDITTAWDRSSFGLLAHGLFRKYVRRLHQEFQGLNVSFWKGGGFVNPGLCLVIPDAIPKEIREKLERRAYDELAMRQIVDQTKIIDKLACFGKRYYRLDYSWAKDFPTVSTQFPVIFFLEPADENCNSGQFTYEDLEDWAKNKGRIIKKKQ